MRNHWFRVVNGLTFCLLCLSLSSPAVLAQNRETRDKIDRMGIQLEELKTEMILLQRQVQTMLETFNKTSGELNTLVVQMSDNLSATRRAQSAISTNTNETGTQVVAMGERMTATNQRMERLSEQFAQLRKVIEDIPKMPTFAQITPGNAEQLFAAAYSDFSRGNYDLALSEFSQYVETFPTSELADNAQYWIAEIRAVQKKWPEAAADYEKVSTISPTGDKAPLAMFKRGGILFDLEMKDDAVAQWLALLQAHPNSPEAALARRRLEEVAPESLAVPEPTPTTRRPPPTRGRRP
ncbi:MAG: tetratricopeptide repeat protein [Blastocatellia bacterium]|jgi:tol-pal system protein YbgF